MKNLVKLLAVLGPLIAYAAWAGSVNAPLTTHTNVSCATTGATALAQSTPAPNDPSGQPNRLCATFQDVGASNNVFVGDCTNTTATTGVELSPGSFLWTYCGSSAVCCFGSGGTATLGVAETTKQ